MSEVLRLAKKDGKTVHFAKLLDLRHPKNAELAKTSSEIKGASCLLGGRQRRRRIQSGVHRCHLQSSCTLSQSFLVWLEKTRDAISPYTQIQMTEAPRLSRWPKEESPANSDHNSSTTKTTKVGITLMIVWYLLNGMYMVAQFVDLLWERKIEEVTKVPTWACPHVHQKGSNYSHL